MRTVLVVLFVLLGCSAEPSAPLPPRCTPGAQVVCACVGGGQGAQACNAAGAFGACVCPDASTADVARDVNLCPASTFCTTPENPSGACFNTQTDVRHCGQCRNACTATQRCDVGFCVEVDPRCTGSTWCPTPETGSGGCFNIQTDNRRCGSCERVCPSGSRCVAAQCVVL